MACRSCGAASFVFPVKNGDSSFFQSSRCNTFRFRVSAVAVMENGGDGKVPRIPKWLEDQGEGGTDVPPAKAR